MQSNTALVSDMPAESKPHQSQKQLDQLAKARAARSKKAKERNADKKTVKNVIKKNKKWGKPIPPGTYDAKVAKVTRKGKKHVVEMDIKGIERKVIQELGTATGRVKLGSRTRRPSLAEVAKAINVLERAGLL